MHIFGNVAEYNPFHKGHKYQLEKARELGATHIVCVMSGDCVQRGDVAIFSKYERAEVAVKNGADLVLELPSPFSCSNGEVFARSAVHILAGLGENVVEKIFFGCETDNPERLIKSADFSQQMKDSAEVRASLSAGYSYPRALSECSGEFGDIFRGANNVLGIEYINACKKLAPWISPLPIKREGSAHDSEISGEMPSGSYIRNLIENGENGDSFLPGKFSGEPAFIKNAEKEILYILCSAERENVENLPDVSVNIANRFFFAVNSGVANLSDFAEKIKSKNITLARIRRMIIHLVLGVKSEDIKLSPYGRILAFNDKGAEILRIAKKSNFPVDVSLKKLENTSLYAERISHLEQNAVRFREICCRDFSGFSNEYTRKITKI